MRQAVIDYLFWVSGFCGEIVVIGILLLKGRWRTFPAFTAVLAWPAFASLALFPMSRHLRSAAYIHYAYIPYVVVNVLLQLAVVVEIARFVLRPTGTWVQDARKQFILSGVAGTAVALALACMVAPPAATRMGSFEVRTSLFSSLLIFELFVAVTLASNRLGLGWRSHVMAITQGFTVWSVVATVVDSLRSYSGARRLSQGTTEVENVVFLVTLAYWGVQLWKQEPERLPISHQLRKFIVALHERVQYDLGEAEQ